MSASSCSPRPRWRIWCALFIAGSKNGELSTAGPYSVVRNLLYLGNLAGVVGFGFAVEQPMLALLLGLVFALFYPSVVAKEEAQLARIFGERYAAYCAAVPRWIPDWSRYQEPSRSRCRRARCAARSWMPCGSCGRSRSGNSSRSCTASSCC